MIGKFLPLLQELSNFVDRCYTVTTNLVQQLSSLLKDKEHLYRTSFKNAHMQTAFKALGSLLTVLITLDYIVDSNESIREYWGFYKSMISHIRNDPSQFNTNDAALMKFEGLLVSVDQTVLIGEIFKGCVEQNFESYQEDEQDIFVEVRGNSVFLKEMLFCMRQNIETAVQIIGTGNELFERKDIVDSMALYVLYRKLLPANVLPDPKLHKFLWEVQKTVPVVILSETVMWTAGEFITDFAFYEIKKPDPIDPSLYRRTFVATFDSQIAARTGALVSQCQAWTILAESKIHSCTRHEQSVEQVLDVRGSILLKGLSLANRANSLVKSCLVMHSEMQVSLSLSLSLIWL